jgi:putative MATE family efflux protein
LFFLVDRAMLGHYRTDALASLRLTSPILWCLTGILAAFSIGSVALVGRAVGAHDRSLATAAARASLWFALTIGIVMSLISLIGIDPILALFPGVTPPVRSAAKGFLQVILIALPFDLVATTAAAMLQAAGNSRTPFIVGGVANLVNLGIDALLIYGRWGLPELGAVGAAIGSATAMTFNAAVLLFVLTRPSGVLTLLPEVDRQKSWMLEKSALQRILRVALPTVGERLSRSVGYMGFTVIISQLGSIAMATHEAALGLEAICYLSADGFGIAVAAIVAQQLGAGHPEGAVRGATVGVGWTIALLSGFGFVFLVLPAQLLGVFTQDANIIQTGIPCLWIAAAAQPFMATSIVLEQALRGAGNTRTPFYISLAGWFVIRLVATSICVFGLHLGLVGVWLGSTCDWFLRSVALTIVFRRKQWFKVVV